MLIKKRHERFSHPGSCIPYPLTSRIRCAECGSFYHRKISKGAIKWVCTKHERNAKACNSYYYAEDRIYDGFISIINKLRFGEEDILWQVITKIESATKLYKQNNKKAQEASQGIAELNAKLLMLEQLRSKGYLSSDIFHSQSREIQAQISILREERQSSFIRDRMKCGKCGWPMLRHYNQKQPIKESWLCTNKDCKCRVRISDGNLLSTCTLLMNRIIENAELLIPKEFGKRSDSPTVHKLQQEIDSELEREYPSEEYIVSKIGDIASQLYKETQAKAMITAQIARKRALLMHPQENFNSDYFQDLIAYISMDGTGKITLHTKTETEISEGE